MSRRINADEGSGHFSEPLSARISTPKTLLSFSREEEPMGLEKSEGVVVIADGMGSCVDDIRNAKAGGRGTQGQIDFGSSHTVTPLLHRLTPQSSTLGTAPPYP